MHRVRLQPPRLLSLSSAGGNTEGTDTPGLMPGNYHTISSPPPPGSACCAFPDSALAAQSVPGNLWGTVIALKLPWMWRGSRAALLPDQPHSAPHPPAWMLGTALEKGRCGQPRRERSHARPAALCEWVGMRDTGCGEKSVQRGQVTCGGRGVALSCPGVRGHHEPRAPSLRCRGASLMSLVIILQV